MLKEEILRALKTVEQCHLSAGIEALSLPELELFFTQLQRFPPTVRAQQQSALKAGMQPKESLFSPLTQFACKGNSGDEQLGRELLGAGKIGCIVLAGGQGTRLGHSGPKGTVAVSPIKGKSLFQLVAERTKAASEQAQCPLPLAIMTSPLNREETEQFFRENAFFGLSCEQVFFFEQAVLPFCDDQGNWILEKPGVLAVGPDGNGSVLSAFQKSGVWEDWQKKGICYLSMIPIDNPLADPFDAEAIGFQHRVQADLLARAVPKLSADEKMGVFVETDQGIRVVEYTELPEEMARAADESGRLSYRLANASLFCFHADFLPRIASLPLHLARKRMGASLIWKFETFVFDLLAFARHPHVLLCAREQTYSPLKNASGEKSVDTVRMALALFDQQIYASLSGLEPPSRLFELDPAFYYPTDTLKQRWQGRPLPPCAYIEP